MTQFLWLSAQIPIQCRLSAEQACSQPTRESSGYSCCLIPGLNSPQGWGARYCDWCGCCSEFLHLLPCCISLKLIMKNCNLQNHGKEKGKGKAKGKRKKENGKGEMKGKGKGKNAENSYCREDTKFYRVTFLIYGLYRPVSACTTWFIWLRNGVKHLSFKLVEKSGQSPGGSSRRHHATLKADYMHSTQKLAFI